MTTLEMKKQIVEICRRLHQKNMLAAADGNVSFKISEDEILITPTQKNKGYITESDIALITLNNEVKSGAPSGERLMHLEVYRCCPNARAVVHAHPPTAIAWSVARPDLTELPSNGLSEVILAVGSVPIAKYAEPGTAQMGEVLRPFLPKRRVMILSRHGALSWGEDLDEAYNGMERIEAIACILKAAHELGGVTDLPDAEVSRLHAIRAKLGERTL